MSNIETAATANNNGAGGRYWADEYYFIKKLETPSAWFNPATSTAKGQEGQILRPQTIYIGGDEVPTWEEPVFDVARYKSARDAYRKGSLKLDDLQSSPWLSTEWDEAAKIRADVLKYGKSYVNSPFRQGSGVITSVDTPAINVIQVLGELLGEDNRDYVLEQAITQAATPNLVLSVDQWSGFSGSQDVGEGVEALVKKGTFARTDYILKKDVAHIAVTDEANVRYERDVFAQHVRHAAQDLRRIKNQKIATELETGASAGTFGDWIAWTSDHRTRDAARDIYAAATIIEANGGIPNTVASHSRVFNDFATNTQLASAGLSGSLDQRFGNSVVNNIPSLAGITWYLDNLKTATLATVYDKSAVLLMQGPTKTEQYRIPGKGINAYITRDWNSVKVIDASRIRNVTGVSA